MNINTNRAIVLLKNIENEVIKYPEFSILDVITLMGIETGGKNIYGDNNKAIGYFQLHKAAIYYVWAYYPQLGEIKFKHKNIKELIYFPNYQVKISIAYLHLLYLKFKDKRKAIQAYNGDIYGTNHYYERFNKYKEYLLKYIIGG
jgi:hypothetical protein